MTGGWVGRWEGLISGDLEGGETRGLGGSADSGARLVSLDAHTPIYTWLHAGHILVCQHVCMSVCLYVCMITLVVSTRILQFKSNTSDNRDQNYMLQAAA